MWHACDITHAHDSKLSRSQSYRLQRPTRYRHRYRHRRHHRLRYRHFPVNFTEKKNDLCTRMMSPDDFSFKLYKYKIRLYCAA